MATYLELCQKVARESGTISGTQPTSVTSQNGRLLLIVQQVAESWREIQASRNAWQFLFKTWQGNLLIGTGCYTPASFNLTDHARWVTDGQVTEAMSLYDPAIGVSDEAALYETDWWLWRRTYDRGSQEQARPSVYAVSAANELCFGRLPDKAYTVRGAYYRTPQALSDNADTPLCPERYHDVIAWHARMKLGGYDEAEWPTSRAQQQYRAIMQDLDRDQLPAMANHTGPLA